MLMCTGTRLQGRSGQAGNETHSLSFWPLQCFKCPPSGLRDHDAFNFEGNRSPPKRLAKASASSGLAKQNTTNRTSSRRRLPKAGITFFVDRSAKET
jgi:hypothetical protein